MARDTWFETVAIAQQRAKKRLPKSVYSSLISASEKGLTVSDNVESFGELGFAPHVVGAPEKREMATTVMGQDISMPVIISPTGVQAVDPDGEVAVARAAAARGTAMGLSSFASKPIEDVVAVNDKIFFQIYWLGGREAIAERVQRAKDAGAVGMIATTDWSFSHGRDWGSPTIPEKMDLATIVKMMPEGLARPRWFLQWAKTLHPPNLRVPNQGRRGEAGPPFFQAYGEWMGTPPGRTSPGCARSGAAPSCSRASFASMMPNVLWTPEFRRSRYPTTVAITWTGPRPRSAACPRSPRPSATRSRCFWTVASAGAATSSRRLRSVPGR